MPKDGIRFMRLLVFFDLPVKTKEDRKRAGTFRRFLLRDGYEMLQLSVYCRICRGQDAVLKHLARLQANMPEEGCVRSLQVTEQQYAHMRIHVGQMRPVEKIGTFQLSFF